MLKLIADERIIFRTEDIKKTFCYSPSIMRYKDRLIVTIDIGGENKAYYNEEKYSELERSMTGVILASDDNGKTFEIKGYFPYYHARLIVDGDVIYIFGHNSDIMIKASYDGGETWTDASKITNGKQFGMSACGYVEHNGFIYVPCEEARYRDIITGWGVAGAAPVLFRAKKGDDLLKPESWSVSESKSFVDIFGFGSSFPGMGIPFLEATKMSWLEFAKDRAMAPIGWTEGNVVKIYDKNHVWYDENAFHMFLRAHTGGTGYAAVVKVRENEDGTMKMELQKAPSLEDIVFLPFPGGQMKFRVIYDDVTKLYWLISSQATDSMTDVRKLPEDRYDLPNNERNRLQLHFSKNMVDWCFAGMIAVGDATKASRHYADAIIDGEDMLVVSRSGEADSSTAHNGNIITMHRIEKFRDLVY